MLRLAIRVARADAELVLAELLELAPSGVEECEDGEIVEYAVYGAPGELPALADLRATAGGALVEIRTTEIADDWADRWRAFHQPVEIAGRLRIRPPWEPAATWAPGAGDLLDIVIDPAQAFGTGAHPTTRLCLELLAEQAKCDVRASTFTCSAGGEGPGPGAVDVGCGSGVLAVAAAKLGYGPVVGLDHEAESVRATLENAEVNGVAGLVTAERFDLLRDGRLPSAPLLLANLLRPLLLCIARVGFESEPPRVMIASGLLEHEADEIAHAFAAGQGLTEQRRLTDQGWAALLLAVAPPGT